MEINWRSIAEVAYNAWRDESAMIGWIGRPFETISVTQQQAWIAAVKEACKLHSIACLV